jgi:hypothetical protein
LQQKGNPFPPKCDGFLSLVRNSLQNCSYNGLSSQTIKYIESELNFVNIKVQNQSPPTLVGLGSGFYYVNKLKAQAQSSMGFGIGPQARFSYLFSQSLSQSLRPIILHKRPGL